MDLGRVGVWWSGSWTVEGDESLNVPAELEALGYTAIWTSGGFNPGLSTRFGRLLAATDELSVVSGIVNIWLTPAEELAQQVADLDLRHPGRFVLGLGASHAPIVDHYNRPYSHVVGYLDALDAAEPTVAPDRRVLAALGPKMLALSAERSAGAHPYFVPVEHTARARRILGPDVLLAPEVTVVLEGDVTTARGIARRFTEGYLGLENYAGNLRSLGYDDTDLAGGGSDRLVDAVVAWGDAAHVAGRVREHLDAGADHVCIQVVTPSASFPLGAYRELASELLDG